MAEARAVAYLPDRLFTATGQGTERGLAVLVEQGMVRDVVSATSLPSNVEMVQLAGVTLMPSLIDAHVHLDLPGDGSTFEALDEDDETLAAAAAARARLSLAAGVGLLRDCGSRGRSVFALRRAVDLGWLDASAVRVAGAPLTVPRGHTWPLGGEAEGVDGVRAAVRARVAAGADFIKVVNSGGGTPGTQAHVAAFPPPELQAIVAEAHGAGLRVTMHCLSAEAIQRAVDAGADQVEHGQFYRDADTIAFDERVCAALADARTVVTPTLTVAAVQAERLEAEGTTADHDRWRRRADAWIDTARRLHAAGVPLVAGTDAGWRHVGYTDLWREVALLREAGLSGPASLEAATATSALAMGLSRAGQIRAGYPADMIAVAGDPVDDARALRQVRLVLKAGRVVRRAGEWRAAAV
jgi:imidazolonepropionase-like amidohydrolase